MLKKRYHMLVCLIVLGMSFFITSCNGTVAPSETVIAQVQDTPTIPVTVFVTQIVATALPTTPVPSPTVTPSPYPTRYDPLDPFNVPVYYPLIGCAASRLHLGDKAFVAAIGDQVKIYFSPDISLDPGARSLALDELLIVTDGPACSGGYLMWFVMADEDDLEGWAPEGNGEQYWLLPLLK